MEVARVVSTSIVKAGSHDQEPMQRIELTPWDLKYLLINYIQQGFLFHKPPTLHQDENSVIHRLKSSLSRTLDLFSPLTGRLAQFKYEDNDTCSFSIICNNAGVDFVHAMADGVTIADILEPVYVPPIVRSLFPLNDVLNYQGVSMPLLAIQVTDLVDGIFIGCSMNHVVADGTSFWHFLNSWSEISRGLDNATHLPILQRWFLDGTNYPIQFHLPKDEKLCESLSNTPQTVQERIFHFTKEKIAALKSKANAEMGTNQITSLQALLAHLCQSVTRNRHLEANQEIVYGMPIGCRSRLQPPLPSQYFGNSIHIGLIMIKAGELLGHGFGHLALEMNKMVTSQTDEKVKSFLESWAKHPHIVIPETRPKKVLITTNSPRFNVYNTDFGWGRPIAVRRGTMGKFDGSIIMFPGVEEGSVELGACLLAETLEAMGKDEEFMDAVTVYQY